MVEQFKKCTKLQLFLSCKNLNNPVGYGGMDPFLEIYEKVNNEQWSKIGATEVAESTLDPIFLTNFTLNYFFEEHQLLKFKLYHSEDGEPIGNPYNLLGECQFAFGQLVGSQGQTLALRLIGNNSKHNGYLIIKCEQVSDSNDKVQFILSGVEIEDISGFFSPLEPFFCINRVLDNSEKQKVYISEHCNGRDVTWRPFEISIQDLCCGDTSRKISIEVFDFSSLSSHQFIGETHLTLAEALDQNFSTYQLINPKRKKKENYVNSGKIVVKKCYLKKQYGFLDYIQGGCKISLEVAIDFTGSNKHPSIPSSLHYIDPDPEKLNQYQKALLAVSEILLNYDNEKKVQMYGFGGKIDHVISHCFPLVDDPLDPYAHGIEGIMSTYKQALNRIGLSGPTLFGDVLQKVITDLEHENINQECQMYKLLLILTDGEIHDMERTIDLIVRASVSPLSIVIVGIGNEKFENMKILDADTNPLVDRNGRHMARDIVQFVSFNEVDHSPYRLAKEVLDEIPREIVNYFNMKGITPNTPVAAPYFRFRSQVDEVSKARD